MSNSDNFGYQKNTGALIKIFFVRAPKKNHHALLEIGKQTDIFYRKHGVSKFVYRLNARENMMDFVNLSKAISANDDEDVWLEILSYRDAKHVEEVMKAMESDKKANELYKESMEIITPGSIVFGDFSRLN
jgi:large subunit ribosomal protein L17